MTDAVTDSFFDHPALYRGTYLEFLGFRLTSWREGFARLEMPVRSEHRNTVGFLHGGVISSLLDIAGAVAGSHGVSKEVVSVTVNLNCNFIAPHRADIVIAEGELIRMTNTLFFAQSKLLDPDNKRLCATATGTYKRQARTRQAENA
ncbi:MAG TPA: PaaI family thioesterase [Woeseiaceae bacterium]|jgi:uncharacterized protein (TIGR00369 family)